MKNINSDGTFTGANFTDAKIEGAKFRENGITKEQLYQTSDYKNGVLKNIEMAGDYSGIDLSNKEIHNCISAVSGSPNFSGANFRNAIISSSFYGAILDNSDFTGAVFKDNLISIKSNVILRNATFESCFVANALTNIDFSGAKFSNGLNLSGASLENLSFKDADFSGAQINLSHIKKFLNVDFENVDITNTTIYVWEDSSQEDAYDGKSIIVQSKNYKNKDLNSILLQEANLSNVDFSDFNMKNIRLYVCEAKNSNFDGANLTSAVFYIEGGTASSNFTGSSFIGADLTNANMSLSIFSNTNLTNATLFGATLNDTDFTDAIICGTDFSSTVSSGFTETQLKNTLSYKQCDLHGIRLEYNNISEWDLSAQNLQNASFFAARMTNTNLTFSDLRGAEMGVINGTPIYKNTIMTDGVIKNFSMESVDDNFAIRKYTPAASGSVMISAKVSEADASISGGAKLTLEQGAFFEVVNGKTLTVASDGLIQIDTDSSGSTIFNVNSSSGLVFEDGATLTVNIVDNIITSDAYTFAVISFEDDSYIAGLNNFVKDETLFLTVNGEKFNGAWNYAVKGNDLSISINVPEPATYAAIFGALALVFAAYRRRK